MYSSITKRPQSCAGKLLGLCDREKIMVTAKLAFVLIQVGSNLWVNPMQVGGIKSYTINSECQTLIFVLSSSNVCSDWSVEKVREALTPAAVAKAMEAAR